MRVLVVAADGQGTGHHRMIWPAGAASQYAQVGLSQALQVAAQTRQPEDRLLAQEVDQVKPHVIVFQRPMSFTIVKLMRELQRVGYAIVVDVDDDFTNLNPENPAAGNTDQENSPVQNRDNHHLACGFADGLTVSTDYMAQAYSHNPNVTIIRNGIPKHWLNVKMPKDNPLAVLWTGVLAFHAGDLEVTGGAIGRACTAAGARFRTIGYSPSVGDAGAYAGAIMQATGTTPDIYQQWPWYNLTEMQWTQAIGRCGLGVVPLVDRPFNRAKSWVKGLEYSGMGLPFVASPLPEYELLHEKGAGLIAHTPEEWQEYLGHLLGDSRFRKEQGEKNREAASKLTIDGKLWIAAWEKALEHSRQALSVA